MIVYKQLKHIEEKAQQCIALHWVFVFVSAYFVLALGGDECLFFVVVYFRFSEDSSGDDFIRSNSIQK